jgi:hypothetical protein
MTGLPYLMQPVLDSPSRTGLRLLGRGQENCLAPPFSGRRHVLFTSLLGPYLLLRAISLVLISPEVGTAALRAGFAVDVRVDVLLQVADDVRR